MAEEGLVELLSLNTNANDMVECEDFCAGYLLFKHPVVQVTSGQGMVFKHAVAQLSHRSVSML